MKRVGCGRIFADDRFNRNTFYNAQVILCGSSIGCRSFYFFVPFGPTGRTAADPARFAARRDVQFRHSHRAGLGDNRPEIRHGIQHAHAHNLPHAECPRHSEPCRTRYGEYSCPAGVGSRRRPGIVRAMVGAGMHRCRISAQTLTHTQKPHGRPAFIGGAPVLWQVWLKKALIHPLCHDFWLSFLFSLWRRSRGLFLLSGRFHRLLNR